MKKTFLFLAFILVTYSLQAQFSVNSNGNANIPSGKSFYIGNFGDSNSRIRLFNSSSYSIMDYNPDLIFRSPTSSGTLATRVIFKVNGFVGINTSAPSYALDVNGYVRGISFINSSDSRLKQNIVPLTDALSKIKELDGVQYNYNTNINVKHKSPIDNEIHEELLIDVPDKRIKVGLIAQDVKETFP